MLIVASLSCVDSVHRKVSSSDKTAAIKTTSTFKLYLLHRSQIGMYNYLNCSMKVLYYIFTNTPGVVRTHFQTNPRIQGGTFDNEIRVGPLTFILIPWDLLLPSTFSSSNLLPPPSYSSQLLNPSSQTSSYLLLKGLR